MGILASKLADAYFFIQLDFALCAPSRCVYVCYYLGNEVFFKKELYSFLNHSYCCGFVQIVMGILASKLADAYCYLVGNLSAVSFMGTLVPVVSLRFPVIQTLCSCFALPGLLLLLPGCP